MITIKGAWTAAAILLAVGGGIGLFSLWFRWCFTFFAGSNLGCLVMLSPFIFFVWFALAVQLADNEKG
jgi:hypothetical protein